MGVLAGSSQNIIFPSSERFHFCNDSVGERELWPAQVKIKPCHQLFFEKLHLDRKMHRCTLTNLCSSFLENPPPLKVAPNHCFVMESLEIKSNSTLMKPWTRFVENIGFKFRNSLSITLQIFLCFRNKSGADTAAFIITTVSVRELRPQATPRGRRLYQPQVSNQEPLDSKTSA